MNNFFREPLVQFLVLGAALFGIFEFVGKLNVEKPSQIVVTPERIDSLNKGFELDFKRPPTPEDTEKLIQDYIREEVLVHEAVKLGLHLEDQKVRMQLRQRMEDAASAIPVPGDDELERFLQDNPEKFRPAPDKPVPPLAEIKPTVQSVWRAVKRKEAGDAAFQNYLKSYPLVIQRPKAPATSPATAAVTQ